MTTKKMLTITGYKNIHTDIVNLLEDARHTASRSANSIMSASYWEIGRRVVEFEQSGASRAKYGVLLVERLATDLTSRFGRGFTKSNIWNMRAFYLSWPREQILQTLSGESRKRKIPRKSAAKQATTIDLIALTNCFPLPWSAYVRLLTVKDASARAFYETKAMRGGWSARQLDRQISSLFYERTALSNKKIAMLGHCTTGTMCYNINKGDIDDRG